MKFGAVYMAAWLWVIPLLIVFYYIVYRLRLKALERFADKDTIDKISITSSLAKKKIKSIMLTSAAFFMLLALLRPQWGFKWQEVKRRGKLLSL